jgi:hypothetical protein
MFNPYQFYTNFDATSTSFVYDEDGGTGNTSGAYEVGGYPGLKSFAVHVDTLNSTSVQVRIEGGTYLGTDIKWVTLWDKTYTAAGSDDVPVWTNKQFVRVGLKITGDAASDDITVIGAFAK